MAESVRGDRGGDLAQVHTTGTIEPLEAIATRQLSSREGTYRVLPTPPGVVLMRAVEPENVRAIRVAGEIAGPGAVCDVFAMLAHVGWRGELVITDVGAARSLFFDKGNVLGAQTTVDAERLGAIMYRYGGLSEEDLALVAAQTRRGGRFGAVALELQLISQEEVFRCLRHQIEEISFAAFAQGGGTFCFFDGFDSARLVSHHVIPAQALVMDGVTRTDEIRYFREKIPSAEYVPFRIQAITPPLPDYEPTYRMIDGVRSIEELGRLTGRGEFAVTKDVFCLERSGHVGVQPPRRTQNPVAIVELGNTLLRAIHSSADAANKGRELRKGLASFASGGSGAIAALLAGAGPASDGTLDARRVAQNHQNQAGAGADHSLRRMLYEYTSFAIFCVGAAAGREREAELSQRLSADLARLEPR